jgi:undecaprenyl-diphosphatase
MHLILTGQIMDWLQIVFLSLLQGLTEFLPVSSSAHLVLPAQLTNWPDQGLAFDVAVHFGTLIAVLAYFRSDLLNMLWAVSRSPSLIGIVGWRTVIRQTAAHDRDLDLVFKLAIATLPVVIVGFASKDFIETQLRTIPVIATTTMLFGALLWYADRRSSSRSIVEWRDALWIGFAQILALIPGTSRSGITITVALLIGLNRVSAARFSFLLSIPAIAGAQLLLTKDLVATEGSINLLPILVGALIAFASAYASIHFFIRLLDRFGMTPYVVYRLLLGTVLWLLIW